MTAPTPLRAAIRPRSLTMPAKSDLDSPAGPMQAILTSGSRSDSCSRSSVS